MPAINHPFQPLFALLRADEFEVYVVGGAVRDWLQGTCPKDVDMVTNEPLSTLYERIEGAALIATKVPLLHFKRDVSVDVSQWEGTNIVSHLRQRDFTMNAMAIDVSGNVIDPLDGKRALEQKTIQLASLKSLYADPVRILRAFRFRSASGFIISVQTMKAIHTEKYKLRDVAKERIGLEMRKIITSSNAEAVLNELNHEHVLPYILPEYTKTSALSFYGVKEEWERWLLLSDQWKVDMTPVFRKWGLATSDVHAYHMRHRLMQGVRTHAPSKRDIYTYGVHVHLQVDRLVSVVDEQFTSREEQIKQLGNLIPIETRMDLLLQPKELLTHFQRTPGRWLGHMMERLESEVVEGTLKNDKQTLWQRAKELDDED
ncbi:hypothetical protein [Geomicrobium sp. JCM 19039]|uniref:hypothetical protein n=1 Tax=Geomicrobium sp. JCM 19039 TaxID=1460636 RepID=UPI00045F11BC|nr:hypothetical protein [Geomicrobium sp. JCM 19039]GAK11195.1 tRNA nucleotidyltransferase [Geomicrobium sp. JCM 19039]